jgi:molecular chaperone GrpE
MFDTSLLPSYNAVTMKKQDIEELDIEIDADTGDDIVAEESELSVASLKAKLKQLRTELTKAKEERNENLTGWQRAKADLVNFRRNVEEDRFRDSARQKGKIIQSILPTLDSFESATADKSWQDVDPHWREGVERIRNQLTSSLEKDGLTTFGAIGEPFDPSMHECMSVTATDDEAQDNIIVQVLQKGYRIGNEVIRPAKVIVYQQV